MANNPTIFNAALSAALGAAEAQRGIRNPVAASYDTLKVAATAFATRVDSLIPTGIITEAEAELMQSICLQILAGKFIKPTSTFTALSLAILALWTSARANLVNELPIVAEFLNWDGLANHTLTPLAANHIPGMYLITGIAVVTTAAAGGIFFRHIEWTDPLGGLQTNDSPAPVSLTVPGTVPQNDPPPTIMSSGATAVTVEFQPAGVVPPLVANLYSSAVFVGKQA